MIRFVAASLAAAFVAFAPTAFAQEQHTTSTTVVPPSLPFSDPGYTANGSFTVTVSNGAGCGSGVYTVFASPIAGSGPGGSTPPNTTTVGYIGFPAGSFLYANAGVGQYDVTAEETGPCNPPVNPVAFVVTVPNRASQGQAAPIPVGHPIALLLAALALAGFGVRRLRRR